MKRVILTRWAKNPRQTLGRLTLDDQSWLTVERSYTDVAHPCIPAGSYPLVLDMYHRGGYPAYEVRDVPGRSRILIHAANRASELEGCIAPGEAMDIVQGEIGVISSRGALASFMLAMNGDGGELIVVESW